MTTFLQLQILKGHKSLRSFLRAARASRPPGGAFLLDRLPDLPVSFAVNLLVSEFSLDTATEKDGKYPAYKIVSKLPAYPINRATEGFLSALDRGCIPGDMISELPCTYIDGCLIVELRDYRDCGGGSSQGGAGTPKVIPRPPNVHKLLLRPDTESIVKETSRLGREGKLSYHEQLELEARSLRAMQPDLCLDPNPKTLSKAASSAYSRCKMALPRRPSIVRYKGSIAARRVQALRSARERRALLTEGKAAERETLAPFPPELIELTVEDLMGSRSSKHTERMPSPVAEDKPIALIREFPSCSKKYRVTIVVTVLNPLLCTSVLSFYGECGCEAVLFKGYDVGLLECCRKFHAVRKEFCGSICEPLLQGSFEEPLRAHSCSTTARFSKAIAKAGLRGYQSLFEPSSTPPFSEFLTPRMQNMLYACKFSRKVVTLHLQLIPGKFEQR